VATFHDYVRRLVTHVNPYTGLSYADDPTIFAYETGNELLGPVWGDKDVPAAWVADVGRLVKTLAPRKLFVDGTYGVNASHLAVDEVDVFSNHYYGPSTDKLEYDLDYGAAPGPSCGCVPDCADVGAVSSVNKTYFAGEYDWTGGPPDKRVDPKTDPMARWFAALEASPYVAGDAFWSLFGRNIPNCNASFFPSSGSPAPACLTGNRPSSTTATATHCSTATRPTRWPSTAASN